MSLTPQFGSLIPTATQEVLNSNYLQFNSAAAGAQNTDTFAQQYLPEIYEQEVERYGNRTLSGFLRMVGAEMPMTSDQVIWSEQNRLHISYASCGQANGGGVGTNPSIITLGGGATAINVISINDTVVVLDPVTGAEAKAKMGTPCCDSREASVLHRIGRPRARRHHPGCVAGSSDESPWPSQSPVL